MSTVTETGPAAIRLSDKRLHLILLAAIVVAFLILPAFVYPIVLLNILIFALFTASYNLLLGTSGMISFGQAAYYGVAAYLTGYAAKVWGFTPELAILAGTGAAIVLGVVFGFLAIRRQGIYFAMITLALAQFVYFLCIQVKQTGGDDGLTAIPRGNLFGFISLQSNMSVYVFVLVVVVACMVLIYRIVDSPFGLMLKAIRDNEVRAMSLGHNVFVSKLLLFTLSAGFAGLAGSLKAIVFQLASLNDVHFSMSGLPILMTLIGGIGTSFGPLVGAVVLVVAQTYLAGISSWVLVVQGLIFMVCVTFFREGIVGWLSQRLKRPL